MIKNDTIAVIDIGSAKTVCAVAKYNDSAETLDLMSLNYQMSKGVKNGKIIDINLASQSISEVISSAEEAINSKIDDVYVAISGGKITSHIIAAKISVNDNYIKEKDVNRAIKMALDNINQEQFEIIHYIPTEYIVDDVAGIANPVGMVGKKLTCRINVILAPASIIQNLDNCFSRSQVNITDIVVGAYASGLGVLSNNEKENGVTLIDIGSMITTIAVYEKSIIKYIDTIPLGSHHITNDIQMAFNISYLQAERLKILDGAVGNIDNDKSVIEIDLNDNLQKMTITKQELSEVIMARVDEILDMITAKINGVNYSYSSQNIVITGGGAALFGLTDYLANKLNRKVTLGLPKAQIEMTDGWEMFNENPAFATTSGLINYAAKKISMRKNNFFTSNNSSFFSKIKGLLGKAKIA